MDNLLEQLQKKQLVWRAAGTKANNAKVSTSYQRLDTALNGGFPKAGLVHIQSRIGLGEVRLVLPAIKSKSSEHLCAFISPPHKINAEFLLAEGLSLDRVMLIESVPTKQSKEQALWSAEQCAKSGACSAVFLWVEKLQIAQAKKLELAANKGQCLIFLFEQSAQQQANLPVSLAMSLDRIGSQTQDLSICIKKQKVGWPVPSFKINVPFKAKMGSPMRQRHKPQSHAANVYALHSNRHH